VHSPARQRHDLLRIIGYTDTVAKLGRLVLNTFTREIADSNLQTTVHFSQLVCTEQTYRHRHESTFVQ